MRLILSLAAILLLSAGAIVQSGEPRAGRAGLLAYSGHYEAMARKAPSFAETKKTDKAATCADSGDSCSWDSDCCSNNCWGGVCQSGNGSCRDSGDSCSWDSDCCSNNCWGGVCQSGNGSCRDVGASCSWDSDCCSNNCWGGACKSS